MNSKKDFLFSNQDWKGVTYALLINNDLLIDLLELIDKNWSISPNKLFSIHSQFVLTFILYLWQAFTLDPPRIFLWSLKNVSNFKRFLGFFS